jgi:hypothetical protein
MKDQPNKLFNSIIIHNVIVKLVIKAKIYLLMITHFEDNQDKKRNGANVNLKL